MTAHDSANTKNRVMDLITKRPFLIASISLSIGIIVTVLSGVLIANQDSDLFSSETSNDIHDDQTIYFDAIEEAAIVVENLNNEAAFGGVKLVQSQQSVEREALSFLYEDLDGDNLLVPNELNSIYKWENDLYERDGWTDVCVLKYPNGAILSNYGSNETYTIEIAPREDAIGCDPMKSIGRIFWGDFTSVSGGLSNFVNNVNDAIFDDPDFGAIVTILDTDLTEDGLNEAKAINDSLATEVYSLMNQLMNMIPLFNGESETLNDVDDVSLLLGYMREFPTIRTYSFQDYLLDKNFSRNNLKSNYARGLTYFGAPLKSFLNDEDDTEAQDVELSDFFISGGLRDELNEVNDDLSGEMRIFYNSEPLVLAEFSEIINRDLTFALGSIVFVYFYIWLQTGSAFIALVGMTEILISLPSAYFVYRFIFQFEFFAAFNAMALYIVLAIGADDIFVFMDAYKQSAYEGPEVLGSLSTRMAWTYNRAVSAMLITSVTTMIAFVVTALSPLVEIKSFGIYAALCILMDFLFIMTWFPACLVIYHNYFEKRKSKCCLVSICSPPPETNTTDEALKLSQNENTQQEMRFWDRFFEGPFSDVILNDKIRYGILTFFTLLLIPIIILSLQAEASTDPEEFFPSDHPFTIVSDVSNNEFGASSEDRFAQIQIVWGIDTIDRDGVNPLFDPSYKGEIVWDDTFVFNGDTQLFIESTCNKARQLDFLNSDPSDRSQGFVSSCFIDDWKLWLENETDKTFPIEDASEALIYLNNWYANANVDDGGTEVLVNSFYSKNLGLTPERLYYCSIVLESLLPDNPFNSNEALEEAFDSFDGFIKEVADAAEPGHDNVFQNTELWITLHTRSIYLTSALTGVVSGTLLAFVVILIATRNVVVAIFATFTIISIIGSVLATIILIGYQLGTVETICLTILAGFSIDYIVHLAHAFVHSTKSGRKEKVREALGVMGVSVLSGMLTSIGASTMLFFCTLVFFTKFGIFLMLTVSYSWVWSNFFFMSWMATVGPNGASHHGEEEKEKKINIEMPEVL